MTINNSQTADNNSLRIVKNTLILVTLRLAIPVLSMILVLTLSRILAAEGLGRYTLASTFLLIFSMLGPLGLSTIITRDGAQNRTELTKLLANAMSLGTISGLLCTALMVVVALLMDYDWLTTEAILILSIAVLPATLGMFLESALVALEKMGGIAVATVTEYSVKVVASVALLLSGYDLNTVLMMAVIGRFLYCVVCWYFLVRNDVHVGWAADRAQLQRLLKLAPTFVLITAFSSLYWQIDIFMLSKLRPIDDVGQYSAAYRLFEVLMIVPQSFCLAIYPQIASAVKHDLQRLSVLGNTAFRYLTALILPAAVCATILSESGLQLLYGDQFVGSALTLSILVWAIIPFSAVRYHAYVLVAANRQNIDLTLNIIMSSVNVVMNYLLIPRYGHLGAAVATLISISLYALIQYLSIRRFLPGHQSGFAYSRILIMATLCIGALVWLLQDINLIVLVVLSPLVYLAMLLLGGFFSVQELKLVGLGKLVDKYQIVKIAGR